MSTIIAVRKNGVAVIAADTLCKLSNMKQDSELINNHSKIIKVGNNFIAQVGDCVFNQAMESYLRRIESVPDLTTTGELFEFACDLHRALKEDYFLLPVEDESDDFESSRHSSLVVNSNGIFGIYELRSVDEYKKYFSFGSGARYALGAMNAVYDTGKTAEEIALIGLEAAAYFDDSTGKPFQLERLDLK